MMTALFTQPIKVDQTGFGHTANRTVSFLSKLGIINTPWPSPRQWNQPHLLYHWVKYAKNWHQRNV